MRRGKKTKLGLLLLVTLFSGSAVWAGVVGTVTQLEGSVTLTRGTEPDVQVLFAELNMEVMEKDIIKTDKGASIEITLGKDTLIRLAESSELTVAEKSGSQAKKSRKTILNLLNGKVKCKVGKLGQAETFKVKTPTAVAGVRGTIFAMSFNRMLGISKLVVLKGFVHFTPIDFSTGSEIKGKGKSVGSGGKGTSHTDGSSSYVDATDEELDDEEDPGEEDPGEEDPGEEDPGEEDPADEDPGDDAMDDEVDDTLDDVIDDVIEDDTTVDEQLDDAGLGDDPLPGPPGQPGR